MRRREFITLLGGTAAAWPLAARAQRSPIPVVGYLSSLGQAISVHFDAGLRRGLSEEGYFEGQNVSIEYRWITDRYNVLPAMAANLVQHHVDVIFAVGPPAVLAAKAASPKTPIVFVTGPIRSNSTLLPASTSLVGTSPVFGWSYPPWPKNDFNLCAICCRRQS
jgi:putative ABC transport system substrate-binding protein